MVKGFLFYFIYFFAGSGIAVGQSVYFTGGLPLDGDNLILIDQKPDSALLTNKVKVVERNLEVFAVNRNLLESTIYDKKGRVLSILIVEKGLINYREEIKFHRKPGVITIYRTIAKKDIIEADKNSSWRFSQYKGLMTIIKTIPDSKIVLKSKYTRINDSVLKYSTFINSVLRDSGTFDCNVIRENLAKQVSIDSTRKGDTTIISTKEFYNKNSRLKHRKYYYRDRLMEIENLSIWRDTIVSRKFILYFYDQMGTLTREEYLYRDKRTWWKKIAHGYDSNHKSVIYQVEEIDWSTKDTTCNIYFADGRIL